MQPLSFEIDQGSTFSKQLQYVDSANNNLFQFATSAASELCVFGNTSNILASMNCAFSTVSSNNDTLTITLSANTTSTLPLFTPMQFDVKVYWTNNTAYILKGIMVVLPTVTQ